MQQAIAIIVVKKLIGSRSLVTQTHRLVLAKTQLTARHRQLASVASRYTVELDYSLMGFVTKWANRKLLICEDDQLLRFSR